MNGQASTDYVAILLLVVVVAAGAAAVAHGAGIGDEVRRQMLRALCVARRGDCEVDRRPCTIASLRRVKGWSVSIAVVKIGHARTVVREERSDGSIAISLVERGERGLQVGAGGRLSVSVGGLQLALGGEALGSALVARGAGRTWVVHDRRDADTVVGLLAALGRDGAGELGPPAAVFGDRSLSSTASGSASVAGLAAGLGLTATDTFGQRLDTATGRRTYYVERRDDWSASASLLGGTEHRGAQPAERYAITVDRDGRPLDLAVVTTGAYSSSSRLPAPLQAATGLLSTTSTRGRSYVEEHHLDLTEPDNLRLARDFFRQVRDPAYRLGPAVSVSRALAARLAAAGTIDARTYMTEGSRAGVDGSVAVGVRLGGSVVRGSESARLVAAATRGIDGLWRRRVDCLRRA
jgi:hypothetical protein